MADTELRAKATAEGFDAAAREVDKVTEAQKRSVEAAREVVAAAEAQERAAKSASLFGESVSRYVPEVQKSREAIARRTIAVDAAAKKDAAAGSRAEAARQKTAEYRNTLNEWTESQDKATASQSDYVELLRRVNPMMGEFADAGVKGVKVLGDLATQNINLNGIRKKAITLAREHAKVLALGGAAAAAAGALWLIVRAYRAVTDEADAARKTQEEYTKSIEAQKEELAALEKQFVAAANARDKFNGVGAETAAQGTDRSQRIADKFSIDPQQAAQVAGEVEGLDLSFDEQAAFTLLRARGREGTSFDPKQGEASRRNQVSATIRDQGEFLDTELGRLNETRGRRTERAVFESRLTEGGAATNLTALLREQFPDMSDEKLAELVRNVQRFRGSQSAFRESRQLRKGFSKRTLETEEEPGTFGPLSGTPSVELTDLEHSQTERALGFLKNERADGRQITININNITHNDERNYQVDKTTFDERSTNGESFNRDTE